jgi:spore maturation protein CgeB
VAVYSRPEEIPDMVRHYLAHPGERDRIAKAARKRVLAEHTYVIRMGQLLDVMRATFS